MFQTTRRRLALWYAAVTAILLLFFATGVYLYVRHTLIERIDDTLQHVVEVVDRSLVMETADQLTYRVNIEASFSKNGSTVEDDRIDLEYFAKDGKLLWSTFKEPLNFPLTPERINKMILSPDRLLRQVTKKIELDSKVVGYLRVSHPWFEVTKPIRNLILDLTVGIVMVVISVGSIGWFLSGIAMEPVRESYHSLKQFTADASHELRNPIATIQTNVQTALADPEASPQRQQQQLKVVERLARRLGHLVDDLLFLARSDSGVLATNYQSVPLDALLMEVIEEQRTIAEQKNIFLSLKIGESETNNSSEDVFNVSGDWEQLARLFTNLIGNALEHIDIIETKEASVEVEIKPIISAPLRGSQRSRQPLLQVTVRDNGIGIAETSLPHIFDRFYRTDLARSRSRPEGISSGAGLGLAIARAIVENHSGQIKVESVENEGSTFTVTLRTIFNERNCYGSSSKMAIAPD